MPQPDSCPAKVPPGLGGRKNDEGALSSLSSLLYVCSRVYGHDCAPQNQQLMFNRVLLFCCPVSNNSVYVFEYHTAWAPLPHTPDHCVIFMPYSIGTPSHPPLKKISRGIPSFQRLAPSWRVGGVQGYMGTPSQHFRVYAAPDQYLLSRSAERRSAERSFGV